MAGPCRGGDCKSMPTLPESVRHTGGAGGGAKPPGAIDGMVRVVGGTACVFGALLP